MLFSSTLTSSGSIRFISHVVRLNLEEAFSKLVHVALFHELYENSQLAAIISTGIIHGVKLVAHSPV